LDVEDNNYQFQKTYLIRKRRIEDFLLEDILMIHVYQFL